MARQPSALLLAALAVVGGAGLVILVQSASSGGTPAPLPSGVVPSGTPAPTPRPASRRGPGARILLVGDSLAQGLTNPLGRIAAEDGHVSFVGHGEKGTRIADWATKPWLAADLARAKPTLVLVSLGTNDMRMTDPSTERAQLEGILRTIEATGAEAILIAPPTMPFVDRGVRAMLAATGRTVYPSAALTIPRAGDKIHPTILGYMAWAGSLWTWL